MEVGPLNSTWNALDRHTFPLALGSSTRSFVSQPTNVSYDVSLNGSSLADREKHFAVSLSFCPSPTMATVLLCHGLPTDGKPR